MPVPNADGLTAQITRTATAAGQIGDNVRAVLAMLAAEVAAGASSQALFDSATAALTPVADGLDATEAALNDVVNPATPVPPPIDVPPAFKKK